MPSGTSVICHLSEPPAWATTTTCWSHTRTRTRTPATDTIWSKWWRLGGTRPLISMSTLTEETRVDTGGSWVCPGLEWTNDTRKINEPQNRNETVRVFRKRRWDKREWTVTTFHFGGFYFPTSCNVSHPDQYTPWRRQGPDSLIGHTGPRSIIVGTHIKYLVDFITHTWWNFNISRYVHILYVIMELMVQYSLFISKNGIISKISKTKTKENQSVYVVTLVSSLFL